MSVPSNSLYRFSMSPGWFHPRLNNAWNRCCASGHVNAVVKDVRLSRSRSADGNETWLMRFFAAAIARRSKGDPAREHVHEAVQLRVRKCPVDVSVPFGGIAVEVIRAENDFERAAAADQMWEAFRTAASGMHSHPDFGLAQSRVLARREAHVAGKDELAAYPAD